MKQSGQGLGLVIFNWLLIAICIGLVAFYFVSEDNYKKQYDALSTELTELQSQNTTQEVTMTEDQQTAIEEITGVDYNRMTSDQSLIDDFLQHAFYWSSYEEYIEQRNYLMDAYQLKEDSSFATQFMPEIGNNTDAEGNNYNKIDNDGYALELSSVKTYCVSVDDNIYHYLSEVKWRAITPKSSTSETQTSLVLFDTDASGKVFNVQCELI